MPFTVPKVVGPIVPDPKQSQGRGNGAGEERGYGVEGERKRGDSTTHPPLLPSLTHGIQQPC